VLELVQVLGSLAKFIREVIWPFFVVSSPNKAVRYTNGRPDKLEYLSFDWKRGKVTRSTRSPVLEPGLYFAMPFFQEIRQTNCAEYYIDISNTPITTKNDVSATVSYNFGYYVSDILLYQSKLHAEGLAKDDAPQAVHSAGNVELAAHASAMTWEDIVGNQELLDRRIFGSLSTALKKWGITMTTGGITICTKAKPIALIKID